MISLVPADCPAIAAQAACYVCMAVMAVVSWFVTLRA